ncbi:hypothetical protein CRM22_011031 [Opisthorchis felineus]|uniref:U2A'/phosphoprotein 32 family A C-terminal domain-containing protein n=1 Tax=Opisthorchis felineus TaxID=147828 RepID=A0A4S2KEX7_OPIFE|nr:hypothetical protein CRM22_011031 [Opisthorchis felineus]
MVRITPELVENSPQFTNAIKDRELDLRGYKFPVVENLGSTLDQFDTIDLSDNEIRKLDGFPLLRRLKSLILTNNKIVRLAEDLGQQIPNINTLILTGNAFSELKELEPLSTCDKLSFLSLVHCPVTMRANYRLFVISRLPALRFLDYRRVTQSERKLARSMFKRLPAIAATPTNVRNPVGKQVNGLPSDHHTTTVKTFIPGAPINQPANLTSAGREESDSGSRSSSEAGATANESTMPPPPGPTHPGSKRPASGGTTQDLFAIQEAIKRAKSMDEVERLHQLLSSGQFAGFAAQWQQHLRQQQQQHQQQQQQQQPQQSPAPEVEQSAEQ